MECLPYTKVFLGHVQWNSQIELNVVKNEGFVEVGDRDVSS